MITAQQTQTLLYHLQSKQTPDFPIFLWQHLQKINFDFSENSLNNIRQFFLQLSTKKFDSEKILAQTGGQTLLLALAVYLAEYLGKITGTVVIWCDYQTANQEIKQQNQQYNSNFTLPNTFGYSLLAKVGGVHCQPLAIIEKMLAGEDDLSDFVKKMQQLIVEKNQVNLFDDANDVAKQYLDKIKTGKLLDTSVGFFAELQNVQFDYSQKSLIDIDNVLKIIKQKYRFHHGDYANFIDNKENQYFCYLLGFYIGATASRLANIAIKWVDFDVMRAMFDDEFENCLEHRFILIMENHYRTPMLVITNYLFDIAPHFPKSSLEFSKILHEQNASVLHIFKLKQTDIQDLPKVWQQSIAPAVKLLHDALQAVVQQKLFNPALLYVQKNLQTQRYESKLLVIDNLNIEQAIDNLYEDIGLYQKTSPFVLACYPMFANLPTGRQKAITLEWRCHSPNLALQLIVPYQDLPDFAILPAVSNQENLSDNMLKLVEAMLWQLSLQKNANHIWADDWQSDFISKTKTYPTVSAIDLAVLPVGEQGVAIGLDVVMPEFNYDKVRWQGFDLPKFVLQMTGVSQSYLQIFAPSRLLNDELFSQINAMNELYRFGKVVWGCVVVADDELSQPCQQIVHDKVLRAEIIYDPTGNMSTDKLQDVASRVAKLKQENIAQLSGNTFFLAMHLQDERSCVFAHAVAQNLLLSTTWVWQRHLPTGILADRLVPIIINPKTDSLHAGRVMILPSRFWQNRQDDGQDLYQYWLKLSLKQVGENLDLMPTILADEQQGNWFEKPPFVGLQGQIFPKFKTNTTAIPNPSVTTMLMQASKPMPTSAITVMPSQNQMPITMPSVEPTIPNISTTPNAISNATNNSKMLLTTELQQQLLANQARLQSELSTKDTDKERKLYMVIIAVVILVGLAMLMAMLMKK